MRVPTVALTRQEPKSALRLAERLGLIVEQMSAEERGLVGERGPQLHLSALSEQAPTGRHCFQQPRHRLGLVVDWGLYVPHEATLLSNLRQVSSTPPRQRGACCQHRDNDIRHLTTY